MGRKWSRSSKLFGGLAVVFGLAAFLVVRGYSERVRAMAPSLGPPTTVLVAAGDLPRGVRLQPTMLRTEIVPSNFAPPGAIPEAEEAAGRVLLAAMSESEVLTDTRLGPGRAGPIAALVPEGFRAVTVPVQLPADSLGPGDRVDLLATYATGRRHTETVAEALPVLAVLGATDPSAGIAGAEATEGTRTLVLLVTPSQAESLASATAFAAVSISIEPPEGAS